MLSLSRFTTLVRQLFSTAGRHAAGGPPHPFAAASGGCFSPAGAFAGSMALPALQGSRMERRVLRTRRNHVLTHSGGLRHPPGSDGCGAGDPA